MRDRLAALDGRITALANLGLELINTDRDLDMRIAALEKAHEDALRELRRHSHECATCGERKGAVGDTPQDLLRDGIMFAKGGE
jgi:hypothetical protein